jgi:phosphomannomutase
MKKLYELELKSRIPSNVKIDIGVSTSNKYIRNLFDNLVKANPDSSERIVFQISSNGKKASAFSEETGFVFYEKLVAICCQNLFEQGQDVALPYSFSQTIDEIAKQYGRKVYRYFDCPDNSSDHEARQITKRIKFPNDGIILAFDVIRILTERNIRFKDIVKSLPQTFTSSRSISCKNQNLNFIKDLSDSDDFEQEGVWVNEEFGKVFIRPSKSGKSILLYAESFSSETASELCSSYEEIIKNKLKG